MGRRKNEQKTLTDSKNAVYHNANICSRCKGWTGIVSELMMKYGPHVLARQKCIDKGTADILPEEKPLSRIKRLLTYHKRFIEASKPVNEIQQNPEKRRIA